ncbi:MAG TPA: Rid family hydrolase [Anaerolineae bacterium]|nr:Rid family hydrolase [Anaerolineae bacterium]HMR67368.1 Rid family hydrolase [Anaerolineae bacterium]
MIERINPFQHGAFGYYSQGVKIDLGPKTMILVAGQIALNNDGTPVAPGDFTAQTRFVFNRIEQVLAASKASIDDVVQARFYITDVSKYGEVSAVRNEYFATARPASVMVEISNTVAAGCDVEIEVMAIIDNA